MNVTARPVERGVFVPVTCIPADKPAVLAIVMVVDPAVVVPVVGVGAIILGVLLGLRRRKKNKNHNKQVNPISLLSQFDKRLIPYNSVTLDKEIGAGS